MNGGEWALLVTTAGVAITGIISAVVAIVGRRPERETLAQAWSRQTLEALGADYRRLRAELDECREALEKCEDERHE